MKLFCKKKYLNPLCQRSFSDQGTGDNSPWSELANEDQVFVTEPTNQIAVVHDNQVDITSDSRLVSVINDTSLNSSDDCRLRGSYVYLLLLFIHTVCCL